MFKTMKNTLFVTLFMLCTLSFPMQVQATHTHTEACYNGTEHHCDGNETTYGLCYTKLIYHQHTNECYSKECPATEIETTTQSYNENVVCSVCASKYIEEIATCKQCNATGSIIYCENPTCENYKSTTIEVTHKALENENIQNFGTLICGKDQNTVDKYERTCNKEDGAYYYGSDKLTPICNTVVVAIRPVTSTQNTKTPNLRLMATYLDEHEAEIDATSTSYLSNMSYINATIQLNYYGLVNKAYTYDTLSTTITLSTPTDAPTPTPTVESTPTPAITSTPTITIAPTQEIEQDEIKEETTEQIEKQTNSIEDVVITAPQETQSSNTGWIVAIIVVIVLVILLIIATAIYYYRVDKEDDMDDMDDMDELDDEDDYLEESEENDMVEDEKFEDTLQSRIFDQTLEIAATSEIIKNQEILSDNVSRILDEQEKNKK